MRAPGPIRFATCWLAIALGGRSWAGDLPKWDPDRAALLNTARGEEQIKFIVRDLVKDGDYAFLCAFKKERSGGIVGTDDMIDVYQYFFVRDAGRWIPLRREGGFTQDVRDVPCEINLRDEVKTVPGESHPIPVQGQDDLVRIIMSEVQWGIRDDLDGGAIEPQWLDLWRLLGRKNVAVDFSIEHAKSKYEPESDRATSEDRACPSSACKLDVKHAFRGLTALKIDARVSSLVWSNCRFDSLIATQACVSEMSALPYCRPGLKFGADRKEIDRCLAEIGKRRHR